MDTLNETPSFAPGWQDAQQGAGAPWSNATAGMNGVPVLALWVAGIALAVIVVLALMMAVRNLEVERHLAVLARASAQSPPLVDIAPPPVAPQTTPAQGIETEAQELAIATAHARRPAAHVDSAKTRMVKRGKTVLAKAPRAGKRKKRQDAHRPLAARLPQATAFKPCPAPGATGAVSCRLDVCRGAAGKSAACRNIKTLRR